MRIQTALRLSGLVAIAIGIAGPATAETILSRSVVANGAGSTTASSYATYVTIGQALTGSCAGGGWRIGSGFWYLPGEGGSAIDEQPVTPPSWFALHIAQGNPARSSVALLFDVPRRAHVALDLYDVAGRRLESLADAVFEPGRYRARVHAGGLGAGVYFCRMRADSFRDTRRLVLIE
ncbi:MAG: hypothetical protein GF330_11800 [Candidatus Eisenbacteria bacterium]|nr:hypothetical protein [Candidatus Eisenbacteria bacterium]